ncbi:hypothetical protein PanWU01x14_289630, partial [Parasponia andersonii]
LCNVVLTKSSSFFLNSVLFNLRLSYKYTITTKRHSFLKQITAPKCSNAQTKRQSHHPSDTTMITIMIFIMMISLRFRTQARNLKLKQPHPLAMSEQDLSLIDQSP